MVRDDPQITVNSGWLVLRNADPFVIQSAIPSARTITHHGVDLLAVKHHIDEVRILRNLGIPVPTHLTTTWNYPGLHKPFKHQKITAEFLALNPRGWVLSETGTGKTKSALWAIDYLMSMGRLSRTLILCPKSTMSQVWANECFQTIPHRTALVISGDVLRKRQLLTHGVDIRIANHDAIKNRKVCKELMEGVDLILLDEASFFRNYNTMRYNALKSILTPTTRLWLMTATPCSNAPTDVWGLARLVRPLSVPPFFGQFKRSTMVQVSPFKWVPKQEAAELTHKAMQPAIRFTKEECLDLPPITYQARECEISPQQHMLAEAMRKHYIATADDSTISAANAAVKLFKLLQIYAGVVYDNTGAAKLLDCKHRIATLKEIVDGAERKVVVWVPFKHVLQHVTEALRAADVETECVFGETSNKERTRIFSAFTQENDGPKVLVAHPATAGHGLTLVTANISVWYAPIFSGEQYLQANDRINRHGQKHHMSVIHIGGSPIEWAVYNVAKTKTDRQGAILTLYSNILRGAM